MKKPTAVVVGSLLIAVVVTLFILQEGFEWGTLRPTVESPAAQHNEATNSTEPSVEVPILAKPTAPSKQPETEPSHELLRLRGEVGQLRRELDTLRQEKTEAMKQAALLQQLLTDPVPPALTNWFLASTYAAIGVDTNSIPSVASGATTNEVLAELRRVGARVLRDEGDFVLADVYPVPAPGSNRSLVEMRMGFYFDDGRLTSRRISREMWGQ
jgi:hypothetical protein